MFFKNPKRTGGVSMKAVIIEISGKKVVALSKKGDFIKLTNRSGFSVGREIEIPSARIINLHAFTRIASIAAMFLLIIGLSLGMYTYYRPYSYIDIDINPSIEITTNVFNRIIHIKGLNKDGEKVLASGKYKNTGIETCIKTVLDSAIKNGYLITDKNNAVLYTVSSKNDEKAIQIKQVIMNSTEKELKEDKVTAEILMEKVSIKNHEDAKIAGISAGKKLLIERLQKTDPKTKLEDYKNASIKSIIKEIQAGKKASLDLNKPKQGTSDEEKIITDSKVIVKNNQETKKEQKKVEKEVKKEELKVEKETKEVKKEEKKVEKEIKNKEKKNQKGIKSKNQKEIQNNQKNEFTDEKTNTLKPEKEEDKLENQDKEVETDNENTTKDKEQKALKDEKAKK